jgi:hypothetical protein
MRDLNPRDFRLRVFETRALGRYANPPRSGYISSVEVNHLVQSARNN